MTPHYISADQVEAKLSWARMVEAIEKGHHLPAPDMQDMFNRRAGDTLLTRSAWIDGLGMAVKSMSIFPNNRYVPSINGAVMVFDDANGQVEAVIEGRLVTKWKTAADSLVGAKWLAGPSPKSLLIIGAGTVALSLIDAYSALYPGIAISVWNRTADRAVALAAKFEHVDAVTDLPPAVANADIVSCATMSPEPILHGDWLSEGTHLDLIGAYRPDMREADDRALARSRIFVDSFASTLDHIGELKIPLSCGTLERADVLGDLRDIIAGRAGRESPDDITLFKNGGGAHLDLMVARVILEAFRAAN